MLNVHVDAVLYPSKVVWEQFSGIVVEHNGSHETIIVTFSSMASGHLSRGILVLLARSAPE
jgi:hypothetical protein